MTVEKLIKQYQKKVEVLDKAIRKINILIKASRIDKTIDKEDLLQERQNAHRDRQIYFQFTKDLEDLKQK
jgi:hypothetical protein